MTMKDGGPAFPTDSEGQISSHAHVPPEVSEECAEAAAEIERLQGALREYERGMKMLEETPYPDCDEMDAAFTVLHHARKRARRALQGED